MNRVLPAALLVAGLLLFGCVQPGGGAQNATAGAVTPGANLSQAGAEEEAQPFSAKAGLSEAQKAILWYKNDAKLVSVQGAVDSAGKSAQWVYAFDSLSAGKGYSISVPGSEEIRDKPFSFKQELGGSWIDSTQAASACSMDSGEFSLEVQDSVPTWTVISGQRVCTVDASSGQVTG